MSTSLAIILSYVSMHPRFSCRYALEKYSMPIFKDGLPVSTRDFGSCQVDVPIQPTQISIQEVTGSILASIGALGGRLVVPKQQQVSNTATPGSRCRTAFIGGETA